MTTEARLKHLHAGLLVCGIFFIVGLALTGRLYPAGFAWEPRHPEYEQMIGVIYATLGVFLILAARNPVEHLSLIWFTVWSSITHGGLMAVQAMVNEDHAHFLGDILALFIVAAVLAALTPRRAALAGLSTGG